MLLLSFLSGYLDNTRTPVHHSVAAPEVRPGMAWFKEEAPGRDPANILKSNCLPP